MKEVIKIANAQAFWGDDPHAAAILLQQQPDIDYLTLDYLAEVSLSIMAAQRAKDANAGYAQDFLNVIKSLVPFWKDGAKVKIVTNAGGLEPKKCALACAEILQKCACSHLRIAVVSGDDILDLIKTKPQLASFNHLETGESILGMIPFLATANAYLGAQPIAEALKLGADIIITGRTADPSLTVAPCIAHFQWALNDYDRLAQATLAGHLIECGTQVTGGISTNWLEMPNLNNLGFPIVEMHSDGDFVITKPENTGGKVSIETVKEQLLYEIGDPDRYLSPDVTLSISRVSLEAVGNDRIRITGANGSPPPSTYKVSATYRDGFKCEGSLVIFGREAAAKARLCGQIVIEHVRAAGYELERSCIECLGCNAVTVGAVPLDISVEHELLECVLRICVADHRIEALECFTKKLAPLVTCGPQGTTGYLSGRPHIRPIFAFWPCLIDTSLVTPHIELIGESS